MSISPELMLAILAMDAYNRGYYAGINLPANSKAIGNASIESQSSSLLDSPSRNASFFAISYTYNNQTVISYRGTDTALAVPWNGYVTALTLYDTPQAVLGITGT